VISKFKFNMPGSKKIHQGDVVVDDDEDLIVPRKKNDVIEIGSFHVYFKINLNEFLFSS
jgi:hypothetical protein